MSLSGKRKMLFLLIPAFFMLLLSGAFLFKSRIFAAMLDDRLREAESRTGWAFSYKEVKISGFSELSIQGLHAVSRNGDTVCALQKANASLNLFYWLNKHPIVRSLELEQGNIAVNHLRAYGNSGKKQEEGIKNGNTAGQLKRRLKKFIPEKLTVQEVLLLYRDSLGEIKVDLDRIVYRSDSLQGRLTLDDGLRQQEWLFSGLNKEGLHISLEPGSPGSIPVMGSRVGADIRIEKAAFHIRFPWEKGNGIHISGSGENLFIYHPKISGDTIHFRHVSASLPLENAPAAIKTDGPGFFCINKINGRFDFTFPLSKAAPLYLLQIETEWIEANDFFSSLPAGAFDNTRTLQAKGRLRYTLDFELDGKNPDSLVFDSFLEQQGLLLDKRAISPLSVMNASFVHTVFENGQAIRSFQVGVENPSFIPLESIPEHLIQAILTAEDPSFFHHRGFIPEAFRESIKENYLSGDFKRGGSTISMQLVKNVFLSRKKTVFRKMEEALIVWLIENNRLVSKQRMMEVYLNIIEWGPGIYGIGEAAAFYFNKKPARLTLQECLFLANIIPRPKNFRYCFDRQGQLRDYMKEQCLFVMRRMAQKELLSEQDTLGLEMEIKLSGRAGSLLMIKDSATQADKPETLYMRQEHPELFPPSR
jgi:hypothetical protein